MTSAACTGLIAALAEVSALQRANPSPTGSPPVDPEMTRVVGRASVVLLSSHFERYHYELAEEAVSYLNALALPSDRYPVALKLEHARIPIDDLARTQWDNRSAGLSEFVATEASLWRKGALVTTLEHARLLETMKAPHPGALLRFYRLLNIPDIFSAVTRRPHTRTAMWLSLDELVAKRNNIAHGDVTTEATQADVKRYSRTVAQFCERVDRKVARSIGTTFKCPRPW